VVAADLVAQLWASRNGALSVQVLQEFYVNVTRKIRAPLPKKVAREVVETYGVWHVEIVTSDDVATASNLEERHKISFWDALIIVAARKAGADKLLSEDLNAGQRIAGVTIENPFAQARVR
jgi:predicted nucleic acid-binding protein